MIFEKNAIFRLLGCLRVNIFTGKQYTSDRQWTDVSSDKIGKFLRIVPRCQTCFR